MVKRAQWEDDPQRPRRIAHYERALRREAHRALYFQRISSIVWIFVREQTMACNPEGRKVGDLNPGTRP
jgi:hypothetical protein